MTRPLKSRLFGKAALAACLATALLIAAQAAAAAELPKPGSSLAAITLPAPEDEAQRAYLGLSPGGALSLASPGRHLLVEIIGVYCPLCHKQAPLFAILYEKINQDPELSGKLAMYGLAAGASPGEMEMLRENATYAFPVAADPEFAVHKQLGEPKTPFIMLVDRSGKVLLTHLGVVEDIETFHQELKKLVK